MRRVARRALVVSAAAAAAVLLAVAFVSLFDPVDRWLARRRTDVFLWLRDAEGEGVHLSRAAFLDRHGRTVARASQAGSSWRLDTRPDEPDWGRRVARVRVDAYGCTVDAPFAAEEQTSGSLLGALAAHPVPREVVFRLHGPLDCRPAAPGGGLPFAALLTAASDGEGIVRFAAVAELERIGAAAAPAVPRLAELVAGSDGPWLRCPAARALGAVGPAAAPAVPELARYAGDADPRRASCAVAAFEGIGAAAPGVLPALTAALVTADPRLRHQAAAVLGRFGADAAAAAPVLVARLDDETEERSVRLAAFSALKAIGTPEAREAMRRYAGRHPILY